MDHGDMDMGTATTTATGTATAAAASATTSASCKIRMLWNWNTIDACFISSSWHITSKGMFAGSCIGVILLVMSLEMLRRSVKEWDRYLIRGHYAKFGGTDSPGSCQPVPGFRPNLWQQAVRALLHMMQFAVAYFVMLLAMYYNGYIIICIFIGAFLGSFVFHWEALTQAGTGQTSATKEATVCCG